MDKLYNPMQIARVNIFFIFLALWAMPCFAVEKLTLQLKWHHQFQFAGYYAAKELGFYHDQGLDVALNPVETQKNPTDSVLNGSAEYAVGSNDLLLQRNAGKPLVALAVIFQHSPYVLLSMQVHGVESVHDLADKKILLDPYATEVIAYLIKSNLKIEHMNIVRAYDYTPNDLITGKIDAYAGYSTNDTFYLEKSGKPFLSFSPRSEGIDFYGDNLYTSESEVKHHPERVKAFLSASLKGWKYAVENPEKTVDMMIAKGYATEGDREKLLYEATRTIQLIHSDIVPLGFMHKERWQHIVDTYIEQNMLPKNFSLQGFLYTDQPEPIPFWIKALVGLLTSLLLVTAGVALYNYQAKMNLFKHFFKSKNRFEKIINRVPGIVFECELNDDDISKIPHAKKYFQEFFESSDKNHNHEWLNVIKALYPEDIDLFINSLTRSAKNLTLWQLECRVSDSQQSTKWIYINASTEKNPAGSVVWYGIISDITDRKNAEMIAEQRTQDILYLSLHDGLTDLPNRKQMHQYLSNKIDDAKQSNKHIALLLIDLDEFKEVNDSLGHLAGDQLIMAVSHRLLSCIESRGLVCRLGGDEFVVILTDLDPNTSTVQTISETIIKEILLPVHHEDTELHVTASIGIALYPRDGQDVHHLLKHADQAMYQAKKRGKNGFYLYTPELNATAESRMQTIKELRQAIINQEFFVEYQPILDLKTGNIIKAEALIRWLHPTRGRIPPDQFITIAEETGLIIDIGNWLLVEVISQLKRFQTSYDKNFTISINMSPVQIQHIGKSKQNWLDIIKQYPFTNGGLIIEITEGVLLNENHVVLKMLSAFKQHGLKIAIDDFGTGYASLAYIQKFEVDFIKIDKSFVQCITEKPQNLALTEAIVLMAEKLNIKCIAEGIETQEQYDTLLEIGCDYGQGFLMHRPMSAQGLEIIFKSTQ